ncbi:hypothetical protein CLORY_13000 [Clostridium oryzae]|uniref:Prepilin-type N-terminal cleavage/methylation domain-containing protein n=2 Tax=Clostridium oryzae TaxID=1450648 RepID=A0A1V4IUX2_9CLOT|nr:hypothetical protein CLORY_13000 [Clostridium oryzae]
MSRITKGYTLLECVLAMAMIDVIMFLCVSIFYAIYKDYNSTIVRAKEYTCVNDAFRFIEYQITKGNKKVEFETNEIVLQPSEIYAEQEAGVPKDKSECILVENNNLYIVHVSYSGKNTLDRILKGVNEFTIEKKKGYVIINILTQEGNRYCKCMNTKFIQ